MNTLDYGDTLFRTDSNLREFIDLKEQYVQFNYRNSVNYNSARLESAELIKQYRNSLHVIFHDYASLLSKYENLIITLS